MGGGEMVVCICWMEIVVGVVVVDGCDGIVGWVCEICGVGF